MRQTRQSHKPGTAEYSIRLADSGSAPLRTLSRQTLAPANTLSLVVRGRPFCRIVMRLVTFENPVRQARIGALTPDRRIVDLNSACSLYLRDVEGETAHDRLADALVPANMRALFEGSDTSLEAAHKAFDYALHLKN